MSDIIRFRTILALTAPLIISQSVILANGIIDLVIVGPLGTGAVAAVSLSTAVCIVLFNFLEGFRTGTTVLVSGAAAMNDDARIQNLVRTALFLAALIGSAIFIAAPFIGNAVFPSDAGIQARGSTYLTIWICTVPVVLFMNVITGLFRGLGDTATPAIIAVCVCTLNALLSYLLVYGGCGMSALGMTGSAWGTLLSESAGLAATLAIAKRKRKTSRYLRLSGENYHFREFSSLAAHIGCASGFTLIALLIFVFMLRGLGERAVAVHQITLQVFNTAYLPAMGFLIAATIIVPRYRATGRPGMIAKAAGRITAMSLGSILAVCAAIFAGAEVIATLFSPSDAAVAHGAARTIRLVCVGEIFCSVYMVMRGVLIGCGDSRFIFFEGLVSAYVVFLPLAYLLAIEEGHGVYGGYCAFIAWCAFDCAALLMRFRRRAKRALRETA